jgi:hypothetical protein
VGTKEAVHNTEKKLVEVDTVVRVHSYTHFENYLTLYIELDTLLICELFEPQWILQAF